MTIPHLFIVVLINMLWGSMFIVATIGLREFPPILFTSIRFLILTLMLSFYIRVPREYICPLLKIGALTGVGMYLTLYLSLALAENTSSVAIISKLEVPFAILLGAVLLKEKIGVRRIVGVMIAMTGALLIGFDPAAFDDLPALFWMTISSAFSAYAAIKVRELGNISPLTITAWVSAVGGPVLVAVSFLFEFEDWNRVGQAGVVGWSALLYTAIVGSIIANSAMYFLIQRYPVSQVAPFLLLSPVFAVIGGVLFLEDQLTTALIAGGLLVLAGVGWITKVNTR
ncbi:MAG: O-acetylserine/cysteine efflux transporter [Parasphingorhabdus sp.]